MAARSWLTTAGGLHLYHLEDADEQQLRQPEPVDVGAVRERAAGELQIRQSGQAGHQVL